MKNKIINLIEKSILTKEKLIALNLYDIEKIVKLCIKSLRHGGKVIFCGNGGSAADSQHLATELVVRFKKNRKSLSAIALTTNTSALTAIGNDFGFDAIFSRQLEALANKKDILVAITTSGKSKNIVEVIKKAKQLGVQSILFTGAKGKALAKKCTAAIVVPEKDTALIQEAHICVGHILCELIEEEIF